MPKRHSLPIIVSVQFNIHVKRSRSFITLKGFLNYIYYFSVYLIVTQPHPRAQKILEHIKYNDLSLIPQLIS